VHVSALSSGQPLVRAGLGNPGTIGWSERLWPHPPTGGGPTRLAMVDTKLHDAAARPILAAGSRTLAPRGSSGQSGPVPISAQRPSVQVRTFVVLVL